MEDGEVQNVKGQEISGQSANLRAFGSNQQVQPEHQSVAHSLKYNRAEMVIFNVCFLLEEKFWGGFAARLFPRRF